MDRRERIAHRGFLSTTRITVRRLRAICSTWSVTVPLHRAAAHRPAAGRPRLRSMWVPCFPTARASWCWSTIIPARRPPISACPSPSSTPRRRRRSSSPTPRTLTRITTTWILLPARLSPRSLPVLHTQLSAEPTSTPRATLHTSLDSIRTRRRLPACCSNTTWRQVPPHRKPSSAAAQRCRNSIAPRRPGVN